MRQCQQLNLNESSIYNTTKSWFRRNPQTADSERAFGTGRIEAIFTPWSKNVEEPGAYTFNIAVTNSLSTVLIR